MNNIQTEVDEFFNWLAQFKTVRVFLEFGLLRAKKIANINGVEVNDGTTYEIVPDDNMTFPDPGDYPASLFPDLIIAASFADANGYIKPTVSRDVLLYKVSDVDGGINSVDHERNLKFRIC